MCIIHTILENEAEEDMSLEKLLSMYKPDEWTSQGNGRFMGRFSDNPLTGLPGIIVKDTRLGQIIVHEQGDLKIGRNQIFDYSADLPPHLSRVDLTNRGLNLGFHLKFMDRHIQELSVHAPALGGSPHYFEITYNPAGEFQQVRYAPDISPDLVFKTFIFDGRKRDHMEALSEVFGENRLDLEELAEKVWENYQSQGIRALYYNELGENVYKDVDNRFQKALSEIPAEWVETLPNLLRDRIHSLFSRFCSEDNEQIDERILDTLTKEATYSASIYRKNFPDLDDIQSFIDPSIADILKSLVTQENRRVLGSGKFVTTIAQTDIDNAYNFTVEGIQGKILYAEEILIEETMSYDGNKYRLRRDGSIHFDIEPMVIGNNGEPAHLNYPPGISVMKIATLACARNQGAWNQAFQFVDVNLHPLRKF